MIKLRPSFALIALALPLFAVPPLAAAEMAWPNKYTGYSGALDDLPAPKTQAPGPHLGNPKLAQPPAPAARGHRRPEGSEPTLEFTSGTPSTLSKSRFPSKSLGSTAPVRPRRGR